MKIVSKKIFPLSAILVLGAMALVFQSCTGDVHFFGGGGLAKGGGTGSGGSYDGKLEGSYVRLLPEHQCPGQSPPSVAEQLIFSTTEATYNVWDFACSHGQSPLDDRRLQVSPNQIDVVGYQDGLFVRGEYLAKKPGSPVIGWCSPQDQTFDILIHDGKSAEILWLDRTTTSSSPVVDMTMRNHILSIRSEAMDVKIDARLAQSLANGLFGGTVSRGPSGFAGAKLACRLGWSYDGRIWPSKMVLAKNFTSSTWSRLESKLYLATTEAAGSAVWSLHLGIDLEPRKLFSDQISRIARLIASPSGRRLAYSAIVTEGAPREIRAFDQQEQKLQLIASGYTDPNSDPGDLLAFSSDGNSLLFHDSYDAVSQQNFDASEKQPVFFNFPTELVSRPTMIGRSPDQTVWGAWPLPGSDRFLLGTSGSMDAHFFLGSKTDGFAKVPVWSGTMDPLLEHSLDVHSLFVFGAQVLDIETRLLPSGRGFFFSTLGSLPQDGFANHLYFYDLVRQTRIRMETFGTVLQVSDLDHVLIADAHQFLRTQGVRYFNADLEAVAVWPEAIGAKFADDHRSILRVDTDGTTTTFKRYDIAAGRDSLVAQIPHQFRRVDSITPIPNSEYFVFMADQSGDTLLELYLLNSSSGEIWLISDRYAQYRGVLKFYFDQERRRVFFLQGTDGYKSNAQRFQGLQHLFMYQIP